MAAAAGSLNLAGLSAVELRILNPQTALKILTH